MELGDGSIGDKHNSGGDGRREQFNVTAKVDVLKRTHVCTKSKHKNKVHGKEEGIGLVADKMESSLHS